MDLRNQCILFPAALIGVTNRWSIKVGSHSTTSGRGAVSCPTLIIYRRASELQIGEASALFCAPQE